MAGTQSWKSAAIPGITPFVMKHRVLRSAQAMSWEG